MHPLSRLEYEVESTNINRIPIKCVHYDRLAKPPLFYWEGIKSTPNGSIVVNLLAPGWKKLDGDKILMIDLVLHHDGTLTTFYDIFEDDYMAFTSDVGAQISTLSEGQICDRYTLVKSTHVTFRYMAPIFHCGKALRKQQRIRFREVAAKILSGADLVQVLGGYFTDRGEKQSFDGFMNVIEKRYSIPKDQ